MKKEHRLRHGEALYHWCHRLAEAYGLTPEQKEMLSEVSKQSYFRGVKGTLLINEKYK